METPIAALTIEICSARCPAIHDSIATLELRSPESGSSREVLDRAPSGEGPWPEALARAADVPDGERPDQEAVVDREEDLVAPDAVRRPHRHERDQEHLHEHEDPVGRVVEPIPVRAGGESSGIRSGCG